ncbi:MAG: phage adaptor protein [Pikeienuella sp.]
MNFGEWKAAVKSAMGREDVPDYVFTLAQDGINRDMRLLDMEAEAEIAVTGNTGSLPSDFGSPMRFVAHHSGTEFPLDAIMPTAIRKETGPGMPRHYAIGNGEVTVSPVPDQGYTFTLGYVKGLPSFSADSDTNAVIVRYPDLYLYLALSHAAVWAKDQEGISTYDAAYKGAKHNAKQDDKRRRMGTKAGTRSARL